MQLLQQRYLPVLIISVCKLHQFILISSFIQVGIDRDLYLSLHSMKVDTWPRFNSMQNKLEQYNSCHELQNQIRCWVPTQSDARRNDLSYKYNYREFLPKYLAKGCIENYFYGCKKKIAYKLKTRKAFVAVYWLPISTYGYIGQSRPYLLYSVGVVRFTESNFQLCKLTKPLT